MLEHGIYKLGAIINSWQFSTENEFNKCSTVQKSGVLTFEGFTDTFTFTRDAPRIQVPRRLRLTLSKEKQNKELQLNVSSHLYMQ